LYFNPAYTGANDMLMISGNLAELKLYKYGSLYEVFADAHSPINKKGSNVGLATCFYGVGPYTHSSYKTSYAYRTKLLNGEIAFGTSLSVNYYKLDSPTWIYPIHDPSVNYTSVFYDFDLGSYYHDDKMYVGISILDMAKQTITADAGVFENNRNKNRNFVLMGGYNFILNTSLSLQPSTNIMFRGRSSYIFLNTLLHYKESVFGGFVFHFQDYIAPIAGFNFNTTRSLFRVSYSHKFKSSQLRTMSYHADELLLTYGFKFNTAKKNK